MDFSPRILLIEDDLADQLAFKRAVKMGQFNYDYSIANSIGEARELLGDEKFNLIITDYFLGDGTAFDVMKMQPDIPLIFVTGGGDEELAVKAMREGAYDYLIKDPDYNYLKFLPVTVENALNYHGSKYKLEESERRYRELFEGTSDFILSFDHNGRFIYVNKAWRDSMGYSEEEVDRMLFTDIVHEEKRAVWDHNFKKLREGEDLFNLQTIFVTRTGEQIFVQGNATASRSGDNVDIRAIFHDVTAQMLAEKSLKRSNEELEQLIAERTRELAKMNESLLIEIEKHKHTEQELKMINEELNTFIYKTSHDIRGPLTSIMGLVNVAKLEEEQEVLQHYFQLVEDRMFHLDDILKELINVSKIKQGVLEHSVIDFRQLMDEILDSLMHMPNFQNIKMEVGIDLTKEYYADQHIIRTILHNLTVNAIKYQQQEEESKSTYKFQVRSIGDNVEIIAQDNGIGIDAHIKEKVFDMFYRGTQQSEGSGLGLYIVKNAVDKLNGEIALDSCVGKGSTFTITLPYQNEEVEVSAIS